MPKLRHAVLILLFASLYLGTAPLEIATGLALVAALLWGERQAMSMAGPVVLVGLCFLASAQGHGTEASVEALGRTWPLVLAVAVPALVAGVDPGRLERVGLGAASVAALWAVGQCAFSGAWPWQAPAAGPFGHHLTLAYALLPALARAVSRRLALPGALIALGLVATWSSGAALAAAVAVAAVAWRPRAALALGAVATVVVVAALKGAAELDQRALLWSTGGLLAVAEPLGVGPSGYRLAAGVVQEGLSPGYNFAMHAHDSPLQLAALTGFGAWIAWAWLLVELWRRAGRAGRAAIAAVGIGALTQDTLGDLEVVRALCAWALLPEPGTALRGHIPDHMEVA